MRRTTKQRATKNFSTVVSQNSFCEKTKKKKLTTWPRTIVVFADITQLPPQTPNKGKKTKQTPLLLRLKLKKPKNQKKKYLRSAICVRMSESCKGVWMH
jgi:hypothetical protein